MIVLLSPGSLMSLTLLCVFVPSGCCANEVLLDPLTCLCFLVFRFPLFSSGNVIVLAHLDKIVTDYGFKSVVK